MTNNALKPCPFCGGEAKLGKADNNFIYSAAVYCSKCLCSTAVAKSPDKSVVQIAIDDWNRRVDPCNTKTP